MLLAPIGWKAITPALIGPGFAVLAGLAAAAADAVNTGTESSVLTIIASILGATGVIGWGFRAWVTQQIRRAEEQRATAAQERAEEREEDRSEREEGRKERERQRAEAAALFERYINERTQHEAFLLAQISMLQQRVDAERERTDRVVTQCLATSPVVTSEDAM